MTYKDIICKFNPKNDLYKKYILEELIFYYSNEIRTDIDLITKKNNLIDFNVDIFEKKILKVLNYNYPIEYIVKRKYFYKRYFYIEKGVFIPRQDTEFLVDWILKNNIIKINSKVVDLCTGSGVIANTISLEKNIEVIGIEKNKTPLKVAKINQKKFGSKVIYLKKDVLKLKKNFFNQFDVIISNPPYIAEDENKLMSPNTIYEPKEALFSKKDDIIFYKKIIENSYESLKKGSKLIFEIGFNQKNKLADFLKSYTFRSQKFIKDLCGNYRILILEK